MNPSPDDVPLPTATASRPGTLAHVMAGRRRATAPRAKTYLRLLWLIPAVATLFIGAIGYRNVPPGGVVDGVKLVTKPGPVGQASEALRLVTGTLDLYLKIKTATTEIRTTTFEDRAIGNGLTWRFETPQALSDVRYVDVWNENTIRSDKNLDHINMDGAWSAEGQTFRIELQGRQHQPPSWALPVLAVGATLTGLVILRFVWDQVV